MIDARCCPARDRRRHAHGAVDADRRRPRIESDETTKAGSDIQVHVQQVAQLRAGRLSWARIACHASLRGRPSSRLPARPAADRPGRRRSLRSARLSPLPRWTPAGVSTVARAVRQQQLVIGQRIGEAGFHVGAIAVGVATSRVQTVDAAGVGRAEGSRHRPRSHRSACFGESRSCRRVADAQQHAGGRWSSASTSGRIGWKSSTVTRHGPLEPRRDVVGVVERRRRPAPALRQACWPARRSSTASASVAGKRSRMARRASCWLAGSDRSGLHVHQRSRRERSRGRGQ